jgi:hypothetical protein
MGHEHDQWTRECGCVEHSEYEDYGMGLVPGGITSYTEKCSAHGGSLPTKMKPDARVDLLTKQIAAANEQVKAIEENVKAKLTELAKVVEAVEEDVKAKLSEPDKVPEQTAVPKHADLDAIEAELDDVFKHKRDYLNSAQPCYVKLASIPITDANREQILRLYQKFTWLQVYPRDYNPGIWAKFSRLTERDRSPTRK